MGLVKNFAYKSILNFFSMILPILVMPYVYRKLSPNSIGMIEYGTSLFTYFSVHVIILCSLIRSYNICSIIT